MLEAPRIIVIETTARRGGIAVALGGQLIASQPLAVDRDYVTDLLPAADALCRQAGWKPADLEQIYVSIGPGSFTGTRIGVTFAKSLSLACGARPVAVPTFQAIARNALQLPDPPTNLVVLMDARGGQVFAEVFRLATEPGADSTSQVPGYESVRAGALVYLSDLLADLPHPVAFAGEGVPVHRKALLDAAGMLLPDDLCVAKVENVHAVGWRMARQDRFSPVDSLIPVYYRLPTPVEKLQAKEKAG